MQQHWRSGYTARITSITTFITAIGSLLLDAFREFVWADLRAGLIDLRDITWPVRTIIWLGLGLTAASLLLLTQTSALRALFPLYTSVIPSPGRGLHIPLILFPLSLGLLSLAWAYVLTGARRSHWLIRLGVVLLYTMSAANWLVTLLVSNPGSVALGMLPVTLALGIVFWPYQPEQNPIAVFTLSLIAAGGLFAVVQIPLLMQDHASGLPIGKTLLEGNLSSLATLAIPLLILIGLDIADFTLSASTWFSQSAAALFPRPLLALLTLLLLAWLTWQGVAYLLTQHATQGLFSLMTLLTGSFGLVLLLWLTWASLARLLPHPPTLDFDQLILAASAIAPVLAIAFMLPLLTDFFFIEVAQVLQGLAIQLQSGFYGDYPRFTTWAMSFYNTATNFSSTAIVHLEGWQRLCALSAIGFGLYLQRRNHPTSALYAATVGVNYLWVEATRPGHWLQFLSWSSTEPVVLAWVLILIGYAAKWAWRSQLSAARINHLLLLTLLLILLRQTDLIAAPLDPLFSLAGVAYLAVGLGWDLLTAGSWANDNSTALPRNSRIFLYLGYMLMTVMLINWAAAAHDFTLLDRFTGETALTGLSLLGYPYLFVAIYLLLTGDPLKSSH